jgi:Phosphotransferase enzyme family
MDNAGVTAAREIATELGLAADTAVVLQDSNKLTLRLLPGDVLARVAPATDQVAQFELDLAQQLTTSPVAALDPRVPARVYERDGFVVTLWAFYESRDAVSPADYAKALARLHAGLREVDIATPHFTDRVEAAQRLLADRDRTPELPDDDRRLLIDTLRHEIGGAEEQVLHGEPHPGNVLNTEYGPLFIDLETCCRGPIEFDLAHAPEEVADHYPDVDHDLLAACRRLVLAMITTWRWDRDDQLPDGRRLAEQWLGQLRVSP